MTTTTNAVVTVSGMDSGGSIPLETFEYGVSKWLQSHTYFITLIPDELLGGTKTTSRSGTAYTNVSFTLQKKCEVYAYYPQWMNTQTQSLVNVLDGMSFDPIDTTLILGMGGSYVTDDFSYSYLFNVRKRMFSEGTHVFPSLGPADGNNNGFITLVFVPFSGTEISIDGILVANIDTPRNRMTENSDILPEEFQGFPTYSYTGSDTYTNNFVVEVIEDVEVYVFTPASVDLTSLGFETYTSTTTDSVWKKVLKKGTSEVFDMVNGILVFKPSIIQTTNANIQNNQWNYLSFTFDKSAKTCKVFINETEVARSDNINTDLVGTDFKDIKIGEGFEGCVDEVGIYNAALPPAMIASLKNNESYIDDFLKRGVVGNWDFSIMSSNADVGVFFADNNSANPATAIGVIGRGLWPGHSSVKFDADPAEYLTVTNNGIDASNLSVALWVNPSSNDQTIVKKNNVFNVRIDSNRNPMMEIGDNTIPVNMTTVDVGVADTTLVGHFKFDGDLNNVYGPVAVDDPPNSTYSVGSNYIQLNGSSYVDIGSNIIPVGTSNLSMSMWVDISSLPENGKLPLISLATSSSARVNESLDWTLTRVGDSLKTDLEFIYTPVMRDFFLSDSAEIHSIANPGWEKLLWPDGSYKTARNPNFPAGTEVVLKTPHTLVNVTPPGYMHQVIALDYYTIGLDTENKLYVQGWFSGSLLIYNFMVDGTATTFPDNWRGGAAQDLPVYFYEAVHLQSLLTPLYGTTAIRAIHSICVRKDVFLIEYDDNSIHLVAVSDYPGGISQPYYSPTHTQTVTGLGGDWELSKVIPGLYTAFVFMKRTGATAPYMAFETETTQYGKDDSDIAHNVRVFTFGQRSIHGLTNYNGSVIIAGKEITGDLYSDRSSGVLYSSTATNAFVVSKYLSGSQISYDGTAGVLQYWLTYHLKYILEEGFLPTRTVQLGDSVLVLFETEDGVKEWHIINNNPWGIAWGNDVYGPRRRRSAQYLLNSNTMDGTNGDRGYSTLLFIGTRVNMKLSTGFVRLQSVMTAFEGLAEDGKGFDDLVFVNKTAPSANGLNSTQLQAYVKSMNKAFTLGRGLSPSGDGVNLVEVTDTFLNLDPQKYIDGKDGPTYGTYGGAAARSHNWLFANNQFAAVPLKAMCLRTWGIVVVRDV
jgi:hypothetical protein